MLNAKLVVVGGDAKAKEVSLKLPTVIGRGKDVTLTLPHALVSRKHTEIFEKDGWLFVKDLGSLNGTYVNNRRIKDPQKLLPNHLLTLGNVTFRAVYQSPVPAEDTERERPTGEQKEDETINFEDLVETSPEKRDEFPVSKDRSTSASEVALKESTPDSADELNERLDRPNLKKEVEPAPSSSIFSGDEEFITPEKSISISALEGLPSQAAQASVSMLGNQLKDIVGLEKQAVDSIDLDVPGASPTAQSDVDLGSFLRKMPR
jgi:pSer/pThr/pTyr-binding forkhead associated (FHA) protein